jgi:hypothetical protein
MDAARIYRRKIWNFCRAEELEDRWKTSIDLRFDERRHVKGCLSPGENYTRQLNGWNR